MTWVVLRNNLAEDGPLEPPMHPGGGSFRYCMYHNDFSEVAFSDDVEEMLEVLIPGYGALDEDEQAFRRIRLAQSAAARVQAEVCAEHEQSEASAEEWATLLSPRSVSQPRADWWTCPIPLVVVETGYAPYTEVPRPASGLSDGLAQPANLWFVRPAEEEDFLLSLHEVGYVKLMQNAEVN